MYLQIVVRLNYGTFGNLIDNKPRGITRRCGALKQINEWVLREPLYLSMMTKIFELCSHDKQKSIRLTFKRIKHKRVVAHICDRVGKYKNGEYEELKTRKGNLS